MFFSPELLAKRDSGFGLLWLAATLGSKSAFRKLPKRSVLTADITQLCDLISQPAEPLALRLSSNLMFGVVRVYKVKQELFLTDVTNCVSSLKKVVQDLRSIAAQEGQLQMANPIARPSAVTIIPNPQVACALDYDALVVDWDDYLNIGDTTLASISAVDADDDDFDPNKKKKRRPKTVSKDAPEPEVVRKEAHTLDEHYEHILSASYDLSFNGSAGLDPSTVGEPGFDNFFSDGLEDTGGYGMELGEDLARELGWAISPLKSARESERHSDLNFDGMNQMPLVDLDFNFNADDTQMAIDPVPIAQRERFENSSCPDSVSKKKINKKENRTGTPSLCAGSVDPRPSAATSFSHQLLSQDNETSRPLRDITTEERNRENQVVPSKKLKRTRLLLDARTELTDDELKIAREKYLHLQRLQRRELLQKRIEKASGRIIEEMIWGAPKGMHARELVRFWQESFKVQVETRSGALRLHEEDGYESPVRQSKRRKMNRNFDAEDANGLPEMIQQEVNINMDNDMNWDFGNNQDVGMNVDDTGPFRYSSEEPGQARRMSKSGSVISANLGLNLKDFDKVGGSGGSHRTSLFPWDNAGPSSSGSGNDVGAGIEGRPEPVNINMRSESINSRYESTLALSQRGSVVGGLTFSPVIGERGSQIMGEDFAFDVDNPVPEGTQQETQKSGMNLVTLERNSYDFLEYAKMQQRSLPRPDDRLSFDVVAPKNTSTCHVAAAAFYHCLVLATKNLIRLEQLAPYEPFFITIK